MKVDLVIKADIAMIDIKTIEQYLKGEITPKEVLRKGMIVYTGQSMGVVVRKEYDYCLVRRHTGMGELTLRYENIRLMFT